MIKKLLSVLAMVSVLTSSTSAQMGSVPFTFVPSTVVKSSEVNTNFSTLYSNALNRTGGTMTGTLISQQITPSSTATYDLGVTGTRFRNAWLSGSVTAGGAVSGLTINSLTLTSASVGFTIAGGTTSKTLTVAGNLTTSGGHDLTLTTTGSTSLTLPTTGTLATLAGSEAFTNKTLTSSTNVLGGVTMTLGSDAAGDIYYRASNVLTRLALGTATKVLVAGASAPAWSSFTLAPPGTSGNVLTSDGTNWLSSPVTVIQGNLVFTSVQFTTNNTTPATVTGLSFTSSSSTVYAIRAVLHATMDSTGGIQIGIGGNETTAAVRFHVTYLGSGGSAASVTPAASTATGNGGTVAVSGGMTQALVLVEGYVSVSTGGTMTIIAAQSSANGSSTIDVGSYLEVTKAS